MGITRSDLNKEQIAHSKSKLEVEQLKAVVDTLKADLVLKALELEVLKKEAEKALDKHHKQVKSLNASCAAKDSKLQKLEQRLSEIDVEVPEERVRYIKVPDLTQVSNEQIEEAYRSLR